MVRGLYGRAISAAVALAALTALPAVASAAPAIPDPDYGPGPVIVAPGEMTGAFDSLQAGDSTLVLGSRGSRPVIASVNSAGDHDPAFGDSGVLRLDLPAGGGSEAPLDGGSLAASPLGGYVGVVSTGASSYLFRISQAGQVDPGFGQSGWVSLPGREAVVAVDAGGRTIAMSYGELPGDPQSPGVRSGLVVRRFDPAGEPDEEFADEGQHTVVTLSSHPVGLNGSRVRPRDVIVHPSGDMTFASWLDPVGSSGSEWWLLRLDSSGAQVGDVKMFRSGQGPSSFLRRAVAGPGESVLVGGAVAAPKVNGSFNGWSQVITRLDETLAPDQGFGDGGFQATHVSGNAAAGWLGRAESGRLYAARTTDSGSQLIVSRLEANGVLDPGYTATHDVPAGESRRIADLTIGPGEEPTALTVIDNAAGEEAAATTRVELVRFVESREGTPPGRPKFRARVLRRKAPASTRRLVRRGVAIRAYCSRACIASVQLRVSGRVAKAANVFSPVARFSRRLGAGVHWFRVPLDVAVRRVLRADPAPLRGIRARVRFRPAG